MRIDRIFLVATVFLISFLSCNSDDDGSTVVLNDKGEQALADDQVLLTYLETHYYNSGDFGGAPINPELIITELSQTDGVYDPAPVNTTILSESPNLHTKVITSDGVDHNLYYLKAREGDGVNPRHPDSVYTNYNGRLTDDTNFDGSVNPVWFDLTQVIEGFSPAMVEFKDATSSVVNPDNTTEFFGYGIGAMFVPSGLAYFEQVPGSIPAYSPLVFTFELYIANEADHDQDHIPSYLEEDDDFTADTYDPVAETFTPDGNPTNDIGDEDLNNNDFDNDNAPNYFDYDDDNDGVPTVNEDLEPDSDLSHDRDGDGDPTNDIGDGDPTNDDTDGDGMPNYLDTDDRISRYDI